MKICKVDKNQPEIVRRLRQHKDLSVCDIHTVGKGCPDIMVGVCGENHLFEIKSGSDAKLTSDEKEFAQSWRGNYHVVWTYQAICGILNIDPIEDSKKPKQVGKQ